MAFEFPDDDTPSPASVTFAKKSAPAKAAAPADTRPWINFKAGAVVPAAVLLVAAIGAGTYLATRKPAPVAPPVVAAPAPVVTPAPVLAPVVPVAASQTPVPAPALAPQVAAAPAPAKAKPHAKKPAAAQPFSGPGVVVSQSTGPAARPANTQQHQQTQQRLNQIVNW